MHSTVAVSVNAGMLTADVCMVARAGQGRAGRGRAGQGRAGQGRAGQGRAGQGRAGQGKARQGQGRARVWQGRADGRQGDTWQRKGVISHKLLNDKHAGSPGCVAISQYMRTRCMMCDHGRCNMLLSLQRLLLISTGGWTNERELRG